jgi:hypothetical protein
VIPEVLISEEQQQPETPLAVEATIAPADAGRSGAVKTDAVPGNNGLFTSLMPPPEPMTGTDRAYYYLNNTFGISALVSSAASPGIRQARNSIPEWGGGIDGYSAYYASTMGRRMVGNSIHQGLSALSGSDPRYYESGRSGFWTRSLYAAGQTLLAHTRSGRARFSYERALGTFGGVLISRNWYPEHRQTVEEYISWTAISFGIDATRNVVREFWPDIKNRLFK